MITFSQLGNYGRLGNQLFQISCVISLALKNNDEYIFPLWKYEKDFSLHGCFSTKINPTKKYQEPFFHYQTIPLTDTKNEIVDLCGYWQSNKYFQDYEGLIKSLLTPKNTFSIKYGTTSIHIRKTDYLQFQDCHPDLGINYYQKAMNIIKSKYYLIVSDDIPWCKQNFKGEQFQFSEADEITDLALQISCEHNICANSSFSWWGAFLNKNPDKIIIAPKIWFGEKLNHDTSDLCPNTWVRI